MHCNLFKMPVQSVERDVIFYCCLRYKQIYRPYFYPFFREVVRCTPLNRRFYMTLLL